MLSIPDLAAEYERSRQEQETRNELFLSKVRAVLLLLFLAHGVLKGVPLPALLFLTLGLAATSLGVLAYLKRHPAYSPWRKVVVTQVDLFVWTGFLYLLSWHGPGWRVAETLNFYMLALIMTSFRTSPQLIILAGLEILGLYQLLFVSLLPPAERPLAAFVAAMQVLLTIAGLHFTVSSMQSTIRQAFLGRRSSELKSLLLANVSHELKTPLSSILGYSYLLQESEDVPEDKRAMLKVVVRNAEGLLRLVQDLLDLGKLEAGQLRLGREELDLGESLEWARRTLEHEVAASPTRVRLALPPEPVVMQGDFPRLCQVFVNLLHNALKFTPSGEVGLELARDGQWAHVTVWDTGVGISEKDLPHIFQEFWQAGNQPRGRRSGSGLGLSIARRLVELHGGTLQVQSRLGEGTRVTVRLPLTRRSDSPGSAPS